MTRVVRYWQSGVFQAEQFYWGWMPPHPTFFVRRRMYEQHGGFNLEMGTAADYELMLRFLLKHQISVAYIPKVLVRMRVGGMSNVSLKNRLTAPASASGSSDCPWMSTGPHHPTYLGHRPPPGPWQWVMPLLRVAVHICTVTAKYAGKIRR